MTNVKRDHLNNKPIDITFLHTDKVHINTFDLLVDSYGLGLDVNHIVHPELLQEAIHKGLTTNLKCRVQNLLEHAHKTSKRVVCTCSTLGQIVETVPLSGGDYAVRIDRAMANAAVKTGHKILVLAALESTIPVSKLLLESAQEQQRTVNHIDYHVIEKCWQYFIEGAQQKYLAHIASYISQHQSEYDCVILAQASMAGASQFLTDNGPPIISSPQIGVQTLIQELIK